MEISHEDFLMFIDRALDGMLRIVEELGEERANMRPDLPGANSPYAILTHCIGVCDYWIGTLLGKREFFRDRDALSSSAMTCWVAWRPSSSRLLRWISYSSLFRAFGTSSLSAPSIPVRLKVKVLPLPLGRRRAWGRSGSSKLWT